MTRKTAPKRPPIHMIDTEADILTDLAIGAQERLPQVSELLLEEIARAKVHSAGRISMDVVTMNAQVEFVDEASAIAAFELPAITDAGECVARHARIGLTQLLVIEGESDEAGRWALQFDVVQLGAIRPCDSR